MWGMTNICDACESAHVRLRHSFQLPVSQLGFYCIWLNYLKFVELHRISSYFLSIRAPLPALSRAECFFFYFDVVFSFTECQGGALTSFGVPLPLNPLVPPSFGVIY